jgi:hypothetical protein
MQIQEIKIHPDIDKYNKAFNYLINEATDYNNLVAFSVSFKDELEVIKTHPALISQLRQIYRWKYERFLGLDK